MQQTLSLEQLSFSLLRSAHQILAKHGVLSDFAICRECFDAIYGSSAGAINATYFLSGQREGVSIYYEDIANKKFVDLGRLLDRKKEQGLLPCLFKAIFRLYAPTHRPSP